MAYNIYLFPLDKWAVYFEGGKKKTVKDWCMACGANMAFNLGYFEMATGKSVTYVKTPRGVISEGGWSDIVTIEQSACKGYSNAIKDGKVFIQDPSKPYGNKRTRNGIGLTASGKVIIAQSSSNVTEQAFATAVNKFVEKQGESVKIFVLQDGGGSTCEYSDRSRLNFAPEGGRPVPTVTLVRRREAQFIKRTLSLGKRGEDVKLLQTVLGGIEADGIYGPLTFLRVRNMQRAYGIKADGIAGPITLRKLGLYQP